MWLLCEVLSSILREPSLPYISEQRSGRRLMTLGEPGQSQVQVVAGAWCGACHLLGPLSK